MPGTAPAAHSSPCAPYQCIPDLLEAQAGYAPDAVAITSPGRQPLTYRRLYGQAADVVAFLNRSGIGRNDRVALVMPNGPEMAVAFLAVAAGATTAPLNPGYRASEYDFYLSDLNVRALIVSPDLDSPAAGVAQSRGIPVMELSALPEAAGLFTLSGGSPGTPGRSGFSQPEDEALVLHTSGTTSRPKIVPLTHRNVCVSAHGIRESLALEASDCCLNVMPLFHIHGLIGALLSSMTATARVVCSPGFDAPRVFEWMEQFRPSWYTAVPTMHQSILTRADSHQETIARCPLRFIRSCSSPLAPAVMAKLENVFGVPVVEAYGMTEASHQIACNPLPPRPRKAGSVGVAAGPQVAIMDEAGHLLSPGETGEIVIRGPGLMRGYEDPQASRKAFTDGWFRTGDQGYLDADGYLFISGRLKEIINRGGEKIAPREVDEVLARHPAVAQAIAFAVPDARLGEEIAAAVVLRRGASATEGELRQYAGARLADFKVPRRVLLVEEIPKGPTGKPQRLGLAEKLGLTRSATEQGESPAAFVAPRTPVEEVLASIWSQVLDLKEVGIHDDFIRVGGDSVLAARLIARVREALRVEISVLSLFEEAATVAGMAARLLSDPQRRARTEKAAELVIRLAQLSDDDVGVMLDQQASTLGQAGQR